MPKIPILQPGQSYTFADYFILNFDPEDILAYFGCSLQLQRLNLPRYIGNLERLVNLKQRIEESLPLLTLTSEIARREFLIAPVLIDLQRGFTQLAVELIALDQWTASEQPVLYGAVSTELIWQFGNLQRQTKQITQDLNLYRVPADLEELLRILVAILSSPSGNL